MDNLLGQQAPIAIISASVIEWLKRQPWFPFINANTVAANRLFAALVAIATSVGIHVTFNTALGGTLTITGLNSSAVMQMAWTAVQQFALQHFIYRTMIKPTNGNGNRSAAIPSAAPKA